jgi:quercetin dioxygenase-like cupin family protein
VKGGPVIELRAGETTYAGPGVVHWHGAAPDKGGVQYNVTRGGIMWGEEVTDKEFRAAPKR